MFFVILAYFSHIIENSLIAFVIKDTGPYLYVPIFYAISTIFVFIYEKFVNSNKPKEKTNWSNIFSHKFALIGYIGGAFVGNGLWFFSIYLIGIGSVSFILIFIRLFVSVYAYIFMNDRYPLDKIIAFITAFLALAFYSYEGIEENWLGITLALISCFAFSAESISKKKLALSNLKPESMVLWRYSVLTLLFSIIFIVLIFLKLIPDEMLLTPSWQSIILICLASFMGSICTNIALFYGLKTVALSKLESLNATKPFMFSIIGVFLLNENMTMSQIVCGVIIVLASLYFLSPQKR